MTDSARIQFNAKQRLFYQTLTKRVDQYFKTNGIKKSGNNSLIFKTTVMFALYFVPYFLLIFNVFSSVWVMLLLAITMGFGVAGIGLSVMHDANHGSYSSSRKFNKIMSYCINLIGGYSLNWQLQHNTIHHTFTNIEGHDEDIDGNGLMRFSPHTPYKKSYRFQYIYAWFLYGLMTLSWIMRKDFVKLAHYEKLGMLKDRKLSYRKEFTKLIALKVFYYSYMVALPLLVIHAHWWQILLGFFAIHYTGGLILAMIFQPAHVVEETSFPMPDKSGNMENDWAVHQLFTTANFAPKARLLSWYVGGLNYQVEHHLFPSICHVHYRNIAPIVKQTAEEFNYPYHSQKTFLGALISHERLLYELGKEPQVAV